MLPFNSFSYGERVPLSYGDRGPSYPDGTATLPTRHRLNTKQWCQEQIAKEQGLLINIIYLINIIQLFILI